MKLIYRTIDWWPGAFHVYDGEKRIGIVNRRVIRGSQGERTVWKAHNEHFFSIRGDFPTRSEAGMAIPKGPIHHDSSALSSY